MSIVIVGGGIIGLSTAYYLIKQQAPESIHIIDSAPELLLSASAFAGGFLAKDWFDPEVAQLGELSFRLHRELADEHDGYRRWGYAPSTSYSLSIDGTGVAKRKTKKHNRNEDWLTEKSSRAEVASNQAGGETNVHTNGNGACQHEMLKSDGTPAWATRQEAGSLDVISSKDGCAQVEPKELCEWLIEQCTSKGVKISLPCQVLRLDKDNTGKVRGLFVKHGTDEQVIPCSKLILSAGAWTPGIFKKIFPSSKLHIPITHLAGYSVVVRSPRYSQPIVDPDCHDEGRVTGMCHSIFSSPGPNWSYAPEIISRTTRAGRPEIYVAGLNEQTMKLPANAGQVKELMDKAKLQDLYQTTVLLTGISAEGSDVTEDDLEVVRQGLCFRPVSSKRTPIVAQLPAKKIGKDIAKDDQFGVFIASGHGPWGISLSLGTGFVIAQMVQGKKLDIDVSQLGI